MDMRWQAGFRCGGTSLSGALRKSDSLLLSVMALLIEFLVYIDWLYVCSSFPLKLRVLEISFLRYTQYGL